MQNQLEKPVIWLQPGTVGYPPAVLLRFTCPASNDRGPRHMENALAAVNSSLAWCGQVTLGIGAVGGEVALFLRCNGAAGQDSFSPLLAHYPQGNITGIPERDDPTVVPPDWRLVTEIVTLTPSLFPILRHGQFEDLLARRHADPLDGILQSLRSEPGVRAWLEFFIEPERRHHSERARWSIELLARDVFHGRQRLSEWYASAVGRGKTGFFVRGLELLAQASARSENHTLLDQSATHHHEREADLHAAAAKLSGHVFRVELQVSVAVPSTAIPVAHARHREIMGALNAFTQSRLATFRRTKRRTTFLLSHEELATLWHPPLAGSGGEHVATSNILERPAPANLPNGSDTHGVTLGQVRFRNDARIVGMRSDDRRRHLYLVGKTGMGKTTLLLNMIAADINAGRGLCLLDPHGDLTEAVLGLVPPERTNQVILLDAGDKDFAVGFNPLSCPNRSRIDQVAGGAVIALRRLYESWGPRLEDTLRNALHAVIEQGGTLVTLLQFLSDGPYRDRIVPRIENPIVRSFFEVEFAGWSRAYRTEALSAIQNKIRPFLTHRSMRAIVSQTDGIDLRTIMDEGQVLLVNLSKGRSGEDNSALLGSLLVTSLQQAAMTRADVPEEHRRDFYAYVDEFQNFVTSSFATILSEARKYRFNLTISHQYLRQLDEATANAVAGNVGSIISFAVGSDDAEWLATAMSKYPGHLSVPDFTNLPKYTACARLLIDGLPSDPFTMTTHPPPQPDSERSQIIREHSRRRYARPIVDGC